MEGPSDPEGAKPLRGGASPLIRTTIAGRYKVEALLGEGGMGAVYLVHHFAIRRRMALKVLHPSQLRVPEIVARFEREAMAAANIDHPNVVAATDFGRTEDGGFFMVLELVDGQRLRDLLQVGPLALPRTLHIARQVTSALVRAHELGIVHRDLKPENIMLTRREGKEDFVRVLDFGLAKVPTDFAAQAGMQTSTPNLTQVGAVFGTLEYIAPEQAVSEEVDIRGDLYSLGIMMYEMLTGRRPFDGTTPLELIQDHMLKPPPPMNERAPAISVPQPVEVLVQRLLAKQPADRFSEPSELLAALDTVSAVGSPDAARSSEAAPVQTASADAVSNSQAPAPQKEAAKAPESITQSQPVRDTAPTSTKRQLGRLSDVLRSIQEELPAPLRKIPPLVLFLFVLTGITGLFVLQLIIVSSSHRSKHTTTGAVASQFQEAPRLTTPGDLERATVQGPEALQELAKQFPQDAQVHRALVQAFAAQHRLAEALRAIASLAVVDPTAGGKAEIIRVIVAALQENDELSAAAVTLMERDLGEAGVDLLYDLTQKQTQVRWKAKVNQSLTKPEVRAKASRSTLVALDLRATKACDARYAMLPRVQREGGERALPLLKGMLQAQGCGFLSLMDCWSCLRKDTRLQDTISALEARLHPPK